MFDEYVHDVLVVLTITVRTVHLLPSLLFYYCYYIIILLLVFFSIAIDIFFAYFRL